MLRLIYILCLSLLLAVSCAGAAWCVWLMLSGDDAGLVNLGKFLVLLLYSAYRLSSILRKRYLIYRSWETGAARRVKGAAHGLLGCGMLLFILAILFLTGVFDVNPQTWFVAAIGAIALGFLSLEVTNALNPERGPGQ